MSERLLKALMQLFAIVADVDGLTNKSRIIVELFLNQQLNSELVHEYLTIYDEYLETHHKISKKKEGKKKRTSVNSVKVLKICTQINEELTQRQKVVVLIRILEYLTSDNVITDQEMEFASTVAETFNISNDEFKDCLNFVTCVTENVPESSSFLLVDKNKNENEQRSKHILSEGLEGSLVIMNISSVQMFALKVFGSDELYLNGQIISNSRTYILTQGSSIRSAKVKPLYYSDIISCFLTDKTTSKIVFETDAIEYRFKGGKIGLHNLTFREESGNMIGIMGGSGAGKSTLLNVLNGNNSPHIGQVRINGVDIHHQKDQIEGVIGYVSQDDLLIEELTVFQNLYYNAKLCFDKFEDEQIKEIVSKLLKDLGLEETSDLKVGSPLEKTISGGQRKRLNIALELIREPSVLFADEPTSGLSSRDSENIMDLLKELSLKGKVVFVVIHQPSSEIFKMFDKLIILDVGGYTIYNGNPVDAVVYFKTIVKHVNCNESECPVCGNVNPEQIFNIIESKVLDEYGNLTDNRKISPKEWNDYYLSKLEKSLPDTNEKHDVPKSTFNIPNKLKQFKVFVTRDVLSKLTNTQYLMINLLEAPVLALILAFFVKYYHSDVSNEIGYIFHQNENLPAYMFMCVVVSLFIGMTVSAEEIIRDQKIRKRESFLNLSNGSYLASKVLIMFVLSAIQSISFVLVGNSILEVQAMTGDYFMVLFTTACFANMLGLNISATFNSAVTIYILIPFLLIPQLLFSGVIVKFEKLNPATTSQTHVPIIGDLMASRWAFEALAVNQFITNQFERDFYHINLRASVAGFKKNFWISELKKKTGSIESFIQKDDRDNEKFSLALEVLRNEINKENVRIEFNYHAGTDTTRKAYPQIENYTEAKVDEEMMKDLKKYLNYLNKEYIREYNRASDERDDSIRTKQKLLGKDEFNRIKNDFENENLSDLVKNETDLNKIIEVDGRFIQRADPVYLDPDGFNAHFFAPRKKLFGKYISTYWANIGVLWFMSILLIVTLYFDVFKRILDGLGMLFSRITSLRK